MVGGLKAGFYDGLYGTSGFFTKPSYFEKVTGFMLVFKRFAGWTLGHKSHCGVAHLNTIPLFDRFLRYLSLIDLCAVGRG